MSGIWTVTFPEIMVQAREMIPNFKDFIGAGLYFHEVSMRKDRSNEAITLSNAKFSVLLFAALNPSSFGRVAESFLEEFREHVSNRHLQDQAITKIIAEPFTKRFPHVRSISISSSHVVRAEMYPDAAKALIREFLRRQ